MGYCCGGIFNVKVKLLKEINFTTYSGMNKTDSIIKLQIDNKKQASDDEFNEQVDPLIVGCSPWSLPQ